MASFNIINLTEETFQDFLASTQTPVLVDFWAPWCGPCRMLGPILDQVAVEAHGKYAIAKVNVDEAPQLSSEFGIRSIPALLYFKNGKLVQQKVGVPSGKEILQTLEALA